MKINNLLRRIVVFLLCMAMTLSYMPASFYAFAQDGEEASAEPEKKAEQIVEEKKEAPKAEEKVAETEKKEESKIEEKTEEKSEAAEMQQIAKEESSAVIEADAVQNEAEEEKVEEEAPAPVKPTPAKNISVKFNFYQLDASGEYVKAKTMSKSVSSGKSTTAISKSNANSYVTNKKFNGDNGMVTEYTQIWKDASGNEVTFPLSMSYETAADLTPDGSNVSVDLYAQYSTHKESAKITLKFEGIRKTNGDVTSAETSNTMSWNGGWSFTKKKFESTTGLRAGQSFSAGGYKYTYTGEWEDQNGNIVSADSSISFKFKEGETFGNNYFITDDTTLTFTPVYDKKMVQRLDCFFIDNISTGSGSWSNASEDISSDFGSHKHTFKDPSVATHVSHYRFLYWEKDSESKSGSNERFYAGDSHTFTVDSSLPEGTITTIKFYAYWQPSVTVNYYVNGKLAESKESFDEIAAYGYEPEMEGADFIGWYAGSDKDADRIADGTAYEAPEVTRDAVDRKVINLYAKFATSYKVEHYLEKLDGSFALNEDASELVKDIVIGSIAKAEEKEFEGYTFDDSAVGTIREAAVEVGLAFKLFYTLNEHTVNYEYSGSLIPDGAMAQIPASATYKYGETVDAGSIPSIEGYTFSGWTGEVSSMPDKDVTVTGSWQINSHKVTYEYTGEIPADAPAVPEEATYEYGAAVAAAEIPAMNGYTFSGWNGEVSSMPDKDVTVTGSWQINSYKVTYEYTGEIPADAPAVPEEATYEYGAAVAAAEIPAIEGYTFSGWSGEVESMPAEDVVVSGSWTKAIVPEVPAKKGSNNVATPAAKVVDIAATTIVEGAAPMAAPAAMSNIADNKTPLAEGTWALVNLIAAIMTALGAMIAIFRRKEEGENADEDDSRAKKMFAAKAAGTLAGIAALITFLLTEDMSLPMAMIDKWTVLMVAMLAVQIVAAVFNKKAAETEDDQETAEEAAN